VAAPSAASLVAPPAPPAPTPFPYTAQSANAKKTTSKLKVDGKKVLVEGSTMKLDPPANQPAQTGGGDVVTHATKNIAVMTTGSMSQTVGGKGVCATGDIAALNVLVEQAKVAQMQLPLLEAGDFDAASKSNAAAAAMNKKYKAAFPPRKAQQCTAGEPVDMGTGYVVANGVDLELPGFVPLVWERSYSSANPLHRGALGKGGWTHSFEQWLEVTEAGFRFHDEEGLPVELGPIENDGLSFHRGRRLELRRAGRSFELRSLDDRLIKIFSALPSGRLALRSIRDARQYMIHLEYDGDTLARIADSVNRELRLTNDEKGRVTRVEVWASEPGSDHAPTLQTWFDYGYQPEGELASHTDALGHAEKWEYDGLHRMIKATLRNGVSFYYEYDAEEGHCVHTWGDGGFHQVRIEIDFEKGETRTHTTNRARRYLWKNGVVYREETFDESWATDRIYDDDLLLIARKNGAGEATTYEHDARGNLVKETDPAGNVTRWEIQDDLVVRQIDPMGLETQYVYDAHGSLIGVNFPGGLSYQFHLNPLGQVDAIYVGSVARKAFRYDAHGNLQAEISRRGAETRYRFDALGRPVEQIDADGGRALLRYDLLGQILEILRPDRTRLSATYDPLGKIDSATDALGNVTRAEHAGSGRLALVIQPDAQRYRLLYDEDERLTGVVNPRLERYEFEYDHADQIVRERTFDGRVTELRYNKAGRVARVDYPEGEWREIQYDKLGNVVEDRGADVQLSFERDAVGRIQRAICQDVTGKIVTELERDQLGRVTADIQNGRPVRYEYDELGRRAARVLPSGERTDYHYDEDDAFAGVSHEGKLVSIERDAHGRERTRRAKGWRLDCEYDKMARLTSQRVIGVDPRAGAPRVLVERRYGYDARGRVTSIDNLRGGRTDYRYDPVDQLLEASRGSLREVFQYDPTGSLVSILSEPAGRTILSLAPGNQLKATERGRYANDGRGRRIQRIERADGDDRAAPLRGERVTTYGWDSKDRLREVVLPDGSRVRFTYDALGRRVQKCVLPPPADLSSILNAASSPAQPLERRSVDFLWDGFVICEEVESDERGARRTRTHVHEPETFVPFLQVEAGQTFGVITDHLGMPKELIDELGRVAWRSEHGAWGNVTRATSNEGAAAVDSPFRLLGQYADQETGLCFTLFRYFEAQTGRWLSPDPLGLLGGKNLSGFNGAPTDATDPLGLTCHKDTNNGKGYTIYHIKANGKIVYVGITESDRFNARIKEHQRSGRLQPGMQMVEADHAETYGAARGYEQAHIEFHGTRDTSARGKPLSTHPANRGWSWDPARANNTSNQRDQSFNQAYQQKTQSLWGSVLAL